MGRVQWSVMAEDEKRKGDGKWGGYSGQWWQKMRREKEMGGGEGTVVSGGRR